MVSYYRQLTLSVKLSTLRLSCLVSINRGIIMFGNGKRIADLEDEFMKLSRRLHELENPPHVFCVGDRVVSIAGFHKGAMGVVKYIEPNGQKIWVLRDGSNGDVWYSPRELSPEAVG